MKKKLLAGLLLVLIATIAIAAWFRSRPSDLANRPSSPAPGELEKRATKSTVSAGDSVSIPDRYELVASQLEDRDELEAAKILRGHLTAHRDALSPESVFEPFTYIRNEYFQQTMRAVATGNFEDALRARSAVLKWEHEFPDEDMRVFVTSDSHKQLGDFCEILGDLESAREHRIRSAGIIREYLGDDDPETRFRQKEVEHVEQLSRMTDGQLAVFQNARKLRYAGFFSAYSDLEKAIELRSESHRLMVTTVGADNLIALDSFRELVSDRIQAGHDAQQLRTVLGELYNRLSSVLENTGHPRAVATLILWSKLELREGNFREALELASRANRELEDALSPTDGRLWRTQRVLARSLSALGRLNESRVCLENALQLVVHDHSVDENTPLELKMELADLLVLTRDLAGAEGLYKECIARFSEWYGPYTEFVHDPLTVAEIGLAGIQIQKREWASARKTLQHAESLVLISPGELTPLYARTLTQRAHLEMCDGQLEMAAEILERALQVHTGDINQVHLSVLQKEKGVLLRETGALEDSISWLHRAIEKERTMPEARRSLLADCHFELACSYDQTGQQAEALNQLHQAMELHRQRAIDIVFAMTETEAIEYTRKLRECLSLYLETIDRGNEDQVRSAMDQVYRAKGLVTTIMTERNRQVRSMNPEALDQFLKIQNLIADQRMDEIAFRLPHEQNDLKLNRLKSLVDLGMKQELETRILEGSDVSVDAHVANDLLIRHELAILEVVLLAQDRDMPPSWFMLLMIPGDNEVQIHALDTIAGIDDTIRHFRSIRDDQVRLRPGHPDQIILRGELASDLMRISEEIVSGIEPLLANREDIKNLVICPDGILGLIPWAELRNSSGEYLIHDYCITYNTSARLQFEQLQIAESEPFHSVFAAAPLCDSPLDDFRQLDESSPEIESLTRWFEDVTLLKAVDATRNQVHQMMSGKQVIYLATHGQALPDRKRFHEYLGFLVFADDQAAGQPAYLTTDHVINSDLQDTQLVVLSACESAMGTVAPGDGVFSLQKAFLLGGADSTLSSLWKVDDTMTCRFMTSFGDKLFGEKMARGEALRETQLQFIREGIGPEHWSAWILNGDPR